MKEKLLNYLRLYWGRNHKDSIGVLWLRVWEYRVQGFEA